MISDKGHGFGPKGHGCDQCVTPKGHGFFEFNNCNFQILGQTVTFFEYF